MTRSLYRALFSAVLGLVVLSASFAPVSGEAGTASKAPAWLIERAAKAEAEVNERRAEQAQAQASLERSEGILVKAQNLKDEAAADVARQAIDLSRRAKEQAALRVRESEGVLRNIQNALLWSLPKDQPAAVLSLSGAQARIKTDRGLAPIDPATPLRIGQTVSAGPDGPVQIFFRDGTRIDLAPNGSFTYEKDTEEESSYRLLNGMLHEIRDIVGAVKRKKIRYAFPGGTLAVRGTEFELIVDERNIGHLRPYSGTMDLSAEKGVESGKLDRWWEDGRAPTPASPLPAGKLLRIDSLKGDVMVRLQDGTTRAAALDDELAKGELLATGIEGMARLTLRGGFRADLAPSSQLEASTQGDTDRPLYALSKGRLRAAGVLDKKQDGADRPQFMTPNALAAGREFQVEVLENGLSDFVAIQGTLEVTAQADPLDMEKIRPWWK